MPTSASPNLIRRFLAWYMSYPPFDPYAEFSFSADFSAARDYLRALSPLDDGSRVTIQHLLVACLARTYAAHPFANAAISRRGEITRFDQVGVVMPVDLGGERETGVFIVERAQSLALRELASITRRGVAGERRSALPSHPLFARITPLLARLPRPLFNGALDAVDAVIGLAPPLERAVRRRFPLTAIVSNVGAKIPLPHGALSRAAGYSPPSRFFNIGTLLGVFPVQEEVVPLRDRSAGVGVKPMLPCSYVFDHRLFDGVKAGRLLGHFIGLLADPAAELGEDGTRPGPERVG